MIDCQLCVARVEHFLTELLLVYLILDKEVARRDRMHQLKVTEASSRHSGALKEADRLAQPVHKHISIIYRAFV